MWKSDPVILLLRGHGHESEVPRLAAQLGLQVVTAPWDHCSLAGGTVSVRAGHGYLGDGTAYPLPGVTSVAPALVAVVEPSVAALSRGAQLAVACDSLWGHCDTIDHFRWPALVEETRYAGDAVISHDPRAPFGLVATSELARKALAQGARAEAPLVRSRVFAPCSVWAVTDERLELVDGLAANCPNATAQRTNVRQWLMALRARIDPPSAIQLQPGQLFPDLFATPQHIDTAYEPKSTILYMDPTLTPDEPQGERVATLMYRLARRRTWGKSNDKDQRVVETGVGRTCLVDGVHVTANPDFADFTVLGVGVTQYSEGGFVEVGRKIDGKATVKRGWHRKYCADRLEREGCRSGRVVAMFEVPGSGVKMLDGSISPEALIVRGFRCTLRVKNLDPLICCFHGTQHVPLVHAYVAERAAKLRRQRGGDSDETELPHTLLSYNATQESLRGLVWDPAPSNEATSWPALVRQVRLDAIAAHVPTLLRLVKDRLARELGVASVDDAGYLAWFAACLGEQLARWRRLRFLHDYHHPGISRWNPGHLYTLGENNVTLLGEFPDLDTGAFVDDPDEELIDVLQLPDSDVETLRAKYSFFHNREIQAAKTVVRTVSAIMSHALGPLDVDANACFEKGYNNA